MHEGIILNEDEGSLLNKSKFFKLFYFFITLTKYYFLLPLTLTLGQ